MSALPIIVAFLMGVSSGYFIGRYLKENDLDIMRIRNTKLKKQIDALNQERHKNIKTRVVGEILPSDARTQR